MKKFGKFNIKLTTPDTKKACFPFRPKKSQKHGEPALMPIQDESSTSLVRIGGSR